MSEVRDSRRQRSGLIRGLRRALSTAHSFVDRRHPNYASLVITRRCNLRCRFCGAFRVRSRGELSTEDVLRCIDRVDRMGVPRFNITGGEPLLRSDIFEILDCAAERFAMGINSNGTLPLGQYERLLETKVGYIGISIHYLNAERHDAVTGVKGSWQRAIDTLTLLRDNSRGKVVSALCTVTADNVDEVLELKKFLNEEVGVVMRITPVATAAPDGSAPSSAIKVTDSSLSAYDERYDRLYEQVRADMGRGVLRSPGYLRLAFEQSRGTKSWQCQAGHLYFSISPQGKFGICQDFDTNLDFLADDFFERYRSPEFQARMIKMRTACGGCTYPCYLQTQIDFDHWWEGLLHAIAFEVRRRRDRSVPERTLVCGRSEKAGIDRRLQPDRKSDATSNP
jgi:MoaA/NifB/PqqE/SkfB family radical SAM enzyme